MGKADISGKKMINIYNRAWAEWVLQQQRIEVEAELSGQFQFLDRATDSLLQVKSAGDRFLVLTELQFRYNEDMPDRLTAYAAPARRKYKQPVFVTVAYLFPPPAGVTIESACHFWRPTNDRLSTILAPGRLRADTPGRRDFAG